MKTTPTDIDREAAAFFELAAGARIFAGGRWARIVSDDGSGGIAATEDMPAQDDRRNALDTDDPATVGCMVAQVEAQAGPVSMTWDRWTGPTRGAALVAAMRALKGQP